MRFLIVDDSRAVQSIVRRAISATGLPDLEFEAASDGQAALEVLGRWQPDMVITDWHMPGMTGIELLKKIRAEHSNVLKVGFVTTESSPENHKEAMRHGALFVLNKPFHAEDLMGLVNEALKTTPQPDRTTERVQVGLADDADISLALHEALSKLVRLNPVPAIESSAINLPAHVSLYVLDRTNEVRGLCLVDFPGMKTICGSLLNKSIPDLRTVVSTNDVTPEMIELLSGFLSRLLPTIYKTGGDQRVKMAKSQLVRQAGTQLNEIIRRCAIRRDFSVLRADLPEGRLTLLAK